MQKPTMLAIAPYQELEISLKECSSEFADTLNVDIVSGDLSSAVQYIHSLINKRYDLIISRGGTAKLLRSFTSIPVIEIETSAYDMLRAIKTAQQYESAFAIVGFSNVTTSATSLKEILRLPCDIIEIIEESQVVQKISTLLELMPQMTIVGDAVTVKTARQLGANSVLITSGQESIRKAFQDALYYYANISHISSDFNIFRDVLKISSKPTIIYNSVGELHFHNLSSNDGIYFTLFDECKAAIGRVRENNDVHFIRHNGRHIFQITGKYIASGSERYYVFFINHSSSKSYTGTFFTYESMENCELEFETLYINSKSLAGLKTKAPTLLSHNVSYFIYGPIGSGTDAAAKYLHFNSRYNQSPMLTIDCRQLTPTNWVSFSKPVNSPLNDVGTTVHFKDLHMLSAEMQDILYRFLCDTDFAKRCLLISSSTDDLRDRILKGTFHHPLITILGEIPLRIPSLKERMDDIPTIAVRLVNRYSKEFGKDIIGFEPKAAMLLKTYQWPLNLDQLKQVVRSLVITTDKAYISAGELKDVLEGSAVNQTQITPFDFSKTLDEIEFDVIQYVLNDVNMNQSKAAQRLGISRSTLWRKISQKPPN